MAKKLKWKGAALSLHGSIPFVGKVKKGVKAAKKSAKILQKKAQTTKPKVRAVLKKGKNKVKKKKKKIKKKTGKVFTKARKLKNNLTKKDLLKKFKKGMKKEVLSAKATLKEIRKPVSKSISSFKEIGTDFTDGLKTRADKALDSPYDFANYMTIGGADAVVAGMAGLKERDDKKMDSIYDFSNWLSAGAVGTLKEAVRPEDPFSKEHWLNSIGVAGSAVGGMKVAVPKSGNVIGKATISKKSVPSKETGQGWNSYLNNEYGSIGKGTGKDPIVNTSSTSTRLKSTKLSSEKINLEWLPDKYTAVEVKGTVKVARKEVDVSRRVYQIEIDKNYYPKEPGTSGMSNKELMEKGRAPYVIKDGEESRVELHHLIQKEPGGVVEIAETTHDKYSSTLHGLVEDGNSFRNDPDLEKQYNNFRSNYWKMRANE